MMSDREYETSVKNLFSSPEGKTLLQELLNRHVMNWDMGKETDGSRSYKIGQRAMVLDFLSCVKGSLDNVVDINFNVF